jgi:hypothetical protein
MSRVIKNLQADPTKESFEMYDVKTRFDNEGNVRLVLPVALEAFREFRKLYSEISKLGDKTTLKDLGGCEGGRIGIVKGDTGFFSKNKRTAYITYRGDGKSFTEIGTCPSQSETWLLDSEAVIDTVLRTSILGERLMEYWVSKDGISKDEAMKRLLEITPNAGFF